MLISMMIAFSIIALRLMYLQVYCNDYFLVKSQKNFTRYETIDSPRGSIRDVHGNLLATNRPVTIVYWQGTGNRHLSEQQHMLLHAIEEITGVLLTAGARFDAVLLGERKKKKIALLTDIDFTTLSKLSESFPNHENLIIDTHFKRFYPYGTYASHVVGYLGNIRVAANGQLGLEKIFDTDLCGKKGFFTQCGQFYRTMHITY